MAALEEHERFIRKFLSQKENTVEDLADVSETTYSEQRDFNSTSIKCFFKEKGIKCRGIASNEQLDHAVRVAVSDVVFRVNAACLHIICSNIVILYCIAFHCIALHCIALHCIALHCIVLYCIFLYCIAITSDIYYCRPYADISIYSKNYLKDCNSYCII